MKKWPLRYVTYFVNSYFKRKIIYIIQFIKKYQIIFTFLSQETNTYFRAIAPSHFPQSHNMCFNDNNNKRLLDIPPAGAIFDKSPLNF